MKKERKKEEKDWEEKKWKKLIDGKMNCYGMEEESGQGCFQSQYI